MKLIVDIPEQHFEIDLDDYMEDLIDEETGEINPDDLFDYFVYPTKSEAKYTYELKE